MIKTVVLLIVFFISAEGFTQISQSDLNDDETADYIRNNSFKLESQRAILWIEKRTLDSVAASHFLSLVTNGISDIEKLTGVKLDSVHYGQSKIEYFISSKTTVSHVYKGYYHNKAEAKSWVFLSSKKVKIRNAPYLHETTHLILWDFGALWLREGVAEYVAYTVANQYGGYYVNMFSEEIPQKSIHDIAKNIIMKDPEIAELIGMEGIPEFESKTQRNKFYLINFSFVSFLFEKIDRSKILEIYKAEKTAEEFIAQTNQNSEFYKTDWLVRLSGSIMK